MPYSLVPSLSSPRAEASPGQSRAARYGAALLTSGLWAVALGYGAWPVAWVAFLPLWITYLLMPVPVATVLRDTAGPALVAHAGAYLIAYPWLATHATPAGTQAGIAAWVLLSLLYSLPLIAGGLHAQRHCCWHGLLLWGGGWILVDLLMQYGPWAFPWVLGAHALVDSPGTAFFIRLGGPVFLTFLLAGMHVLLAAVVVHVVRPRHLSAHPRSDVEEHNVEGHNSVWIRAAGAVAGGAALLVAALVAMLPAAPDTSSPGPPSRGAPTAWVVQPAMPPTTWSDAQASARRAALMHQTTTALDTASTRPDLIVWPETALHAADTLGLQQNVTAWQVPLLAGAVLPADEHGLHTNAALLLRPGGAAQRYDKRHLVPLVEFVPGSTLWRGLQRFQLAHDMSRAYRPGTGLHPVTADTSTFIPLICFESLFSSYVATAGPTLHEATGMITLAQTDWWGRAQPARQHVHYSRLRAIETGRPLLIASVGGPSTLVYPSGKAEELVAYGTSGVATVQWPRTQPAGAHMRMAPYTDIAWTVVGILLVYTVTRRNP